MRKLITLALVVAAAPMFADGNSDSTTAKAGVNLYAPVKISKAQDISFGAVVLTSTTDKLKVTMAQDGTVTYENGAALKGKNSAAPQVALFNFTKDNTLTVAWNIPTELYLDTANKVKWTVDYKITGDEQDSLLGNVVLFGTLDAAAGVTGKFEKEFTVAVNYN